MRNSTNKLKKRKARYSELDLWLAFAIGMLIAVLLVALISPDFMWFMPSP